MPSVAVALAGETRRIDAPAEPAHERRIKAGIARHSLADALQRRRIAFAAQQVGQIGAGRIGLDVGEFVASVRPPSRPRAAAACEGRRVAKVKGLLAPSNQLKSMTGEIITMPLTPTPS